jgi:RND superfamily putative drug exporter
MRRVTDFLTGRRTSWIVLAISLIAAALLFLAGGGVKSEAAPSLGLPTGAESVRVAELEKSLPSSGATSMLTGR